MFDPVPLTFTLNPIHADDIFSIDICNLETVDLDGVASSFLLTAIRFVHSDRLDSLARIDWNGVGSPIFILRFLCFK